MARGAGAALHREAHRLVEHQHVGVLVQRDRAQELARLLVSLAACRRRLRFAEFQRRDAHVLPRRQPVLRLDALAVHAQLAFADDALDVGERKPGKPRLEETIDAHAGFIAANRDGLHAGGEPPAPARASRHRARSPSADAGKVAALLPARGRMTLSPGPGPGLSGSPRCWRPASVLVFAALDLSAFAWGMAFHGAGLAEKAARVILAGFRPRSIRCVSIPGKIRVNRRKPMRLRALPCTLAMTLGFGTIAATTAQAQMPADLVDKSPPSAASPIPRRPANSMPRCRRRSPIPASRSRAT